MWTTFSVFVGALLLVSCSASNNNQEHEKQRWIQELLAKKINPNSVLHNNKGQWTQDSFHQQRNTNHRLSQVQLGNRDRYQANWVPESQEQAPAAVHSKRLSALADRICWEDGVTCEADKTCVNCCTTTTTGDVCGSGECIADGASCVDTLTGEYTCDKCCNGTYSGYTCGQECMAVGTVCDTNSTWSCMGCCNYTYVSVGDEYMCGCKADGESCIPGIDCYSCCNGAYDNDGLTCGGTCLPDATECTYGEDCNQCCSYFSYWYSTGKTQCGYEPCFPDGESCIPGVTCTKCCSGGAFEGDGTICGGECIPEGSSCNYLTSCSSCCPTKWQEFPYVDTNTTTSDSSLSPSISPIKSDYPMFYGGPSSYWNYTTNSMVCGYEGCWANGTSCTPQDTCYKCCSGAHANGGTECGGECLPAGTTCDYYSTCNSCCEYSSMYDKTLKSFVCYSWESMHNNTNTDDSV